jgi:hypothetical protein
MKKVLVTSFTILTLMVIAPAPVNAQGNTPCGADAVWTAFGCIQAQPQQFVSAVLRIAMGVGGGVAFLLILLGGFQMLTSAGDPEKLKSGRDQTTSAVTGLLLIIFSVFFLNFVGFSIFGIPGFGSGGPSATVPTSPPPPSPSAPLTSEVSDCISGVLTQTPSTETDPADVNGPSPVTLTATGTNFANGAADGQCAVADASCTMTNGSSGVCLDNGSGAGVCTSATPKIDPLFNTGCGPDSICHIAPEKVGRKNFIGQTKTEGFGQQDPTGSPWDYVLSWLGVVKPDNTYHYGTELLANFGKQAKDSYGADLAPAGMQAITLHDTQPKPYCMTSRLCVYDPVTGELLGNYLTQETWCTVDPPYRKELIEGSRLGAAYTTNYCVGSDLRLPYTVVKKVAALSCGSSLDEGRIQDLQNKTYIKENYYGGDAITHYAITIQADMVSLIEQFIERLEKTVTRFTATSHNPAVDVGSYENSVSASLGGVSFGVSEDEIKPFAYPVTQAGREGLTKAGGLWNTYRNDAFDPKFRTLADAIYTVQDWYYGIAGTGNIQSPTSQSFNARQENAQLLGNCSIRSANDPVYTELGCPTKKWVGTTTEQISSNDEYPPGPENTSTWASTPGGTSANPVPPGFTPPSSITAGNALALVPACVLEGVAKIEGAYDGGAPCSPNECGAYGPFQITIGNCKPSCGASSCPNAASALGVTKDQLCDFNSAAYQAARLLVGKAKYWGTPISATSPVQSQRAAIINGADSYYGAGIPISRLGGLSYGEWVYQHCDPTATVTHIDHQVGHYPGTP